MDVRSPGPLCEELGPYGKVLALDSIAPMPILGRRSITKGVVPVSKKR